MNGDLMVRHMLLWKGYDSGLPGMESSFASDWSLEARAVWGIRSKAAERWARCNEFCVSALSDDCKAVSAPITRVSASQSSLISVSMSSIAAAVTAVAILGMPRPSEEKIVACAVLLDKPQDLMTATATLESSSARSLGGGSWTRAGYTTLG